MWEESGVAEKENYRHNILKTLAEPEWTMFHDQKRHNHEN